MLAKGIHVDEDARAAVELQAKACDLGDVASCVHAGLAFGCGNGVDADPKRAATYYGKACDGGERTRDTAVQRCDLRALELARPTPGAPALAWAAHSSPSLQAA
jgi:TPR repeat protein